MPYLKTLLPGWLITLTAAAMPLTALANQQPPSLELVKTQVQQYCGGCHVVPSPALMPKKDWPKVVSAMDDLASKRIGQKFMPQDALRNVTAFYYGSSQEQLPELPYFTPNPTSSTHKHILGDIVQTPLVVNINRVELFDNDTPEFLISDAGYNQIRLLSKQGEEWQEQVIADIVIPSHTEVADYDEDGDKDIIVGALGYFPPSEKLAGKVFLLSQQPDGSFKKHTLLQDVGRITDVRPLDIDGDNDLDLAVSIFGGGLVGELLWLENLGNGQHNVHQLLKLSGGLNISPIDLNNDGLIDFVSLMAQEYEMVMALVNQGNGKFGQQVLARAPHPMYGFTGMQLADIDGDKDMDFILTNGDALDTQPDPKPYHGVQWLENRGNLEFVFHEVGRFYGAATAMGADMDNDGDTDIVASSWYNFWEDKRRQSLIWYENDGRQNFTRHNILNQPHSIVSLELEDMDGDNKLDIISSIFRIDLWLQQAGRTDDPEPSDTEELKSRVVWVNNDALSGDTQSK